MIEFRSGLRLGRRGTVVGIAILAAIVCGLGSSIMQELAHSQRNSYNDQNAYEETVQQRCLESARSEAARCPMPHPDAEFAERTGELGARARGLQSLGGSIGWAQSWLLTLIGIAVLVIAVAASSSVDLEKGRLLAGWHPHHRARRSFLVAAAAGLCASGIVATGATVGAVTMSLVGRLIWPLNGEPEHANVAGLGDVALLGPSAGGVVGLLGVIGVLIFVSWVSRRSLATIFVGGGIFSLAAAVGTSLPAWVPGVALPTTAGMWFRHRGEVIHIWSWPDKPGVGLDSFDWYTFGAADPGGTALLGALGLLVVLLALVPLAMRRKLN